MATFPDTWRRRIGILFLLMAVVLLLTGQTVLRPYLHGVNYLLYWLACFLFTGLAVLVALIDWWIVRRRSRAQQRKLVEDALRDIPLDSGSIDEQDSEDEKLE